MPLSQYPHFSSSARLHYLDYLRGLAAVGVMLYHFFLWGIKSFTANEFLGRIGIYGVSIFYILSGIALYYAYADKIFLHWNGLRGFFLKRVFRIYPLLWLVTTITIFKNSISVSIWPVFMNYSGLFGLLNWSGHYSPVAWSIGNELVYYLLFPLLLVFIRKRIFWIGLVGVLCLFIYFTYFKLSANETIADQWVTYTNPLNNLLYFVAGVGLASIKKISLPVPMLSGILVVSVGLLVMLPLPPEFSNLIFGTSRLLLSTSCIVLCFVLYSLEGKPAEIIHKPLSLLGKISYSVYLLHPLTWGVSGWAVHLVLNGFGIETVNFWHLPTAFALTLILSVFSYYYLEKSCIRLGNKLATLYTEQQ